MSVKTSSAAEAVFMSTPVVVGGVFASYVLFCIGGNRSLRNRIPVRIMTAVFLALSINSVSWFINIIVSTKINNFTDSASCLINAYVMSTLQYGIVAMLTFVIVDQYIACTMPLQYRSVMTLKKCNRIMILLWTIVCLFELPLLITMGGAKDKGPSYFDLIGVCYSSYVNFDISGNYMVYMCWSLLELTVVYVVPIYVMVHLSYNSYRVMNHRKRASMFSQKAEQELKEQSNKAAKIMEKQEKPIDKDKNEKLKALLSLYAKPMVKTALILCFVLLSLVSHSLLRFYEPVKDYFGPQSSESIQLTVNCLRSAISLGLILSAGRIVGSLQLIILRNRYC